LRGKLNEKWEGVVPGEPGFFGSHFLMLVRALLAFRTVPFY
jgi:hypothetical protein